MGCVEVLQSMRALDFNTRTQVTRWDYTQLIGCRFDLSLVSFLFCFWGGEMLKVWLHFEKCYGSHIHHSPRIYSFARSLASAPFFLRGLFSFCFSIWLHLPVCVCMYTPAALRAPKLECSGILVVSIWFPQWCLSPWQRRAQSPGTINSITRCQISFNIHKCESGKVFRSITCHLQTCMFFIFQGSYLCGVWGSTRCQRSPQEKGRRYIQEHTPIQSIIYL